MTQKTKNAGKPAEVCLGMVLWHCMMCIMAGCSQMDLNSYTGVVFTAQSDLAAIPCSRTSLKVMSGKDTIPFYHSVNQSICSWTNYGMDYFDYYHLYYQYCFMRDSTDTAVVLYSDSLKLPQDQVLGYHFYLGRTYTFAEPLSKTVPLGAITGDTMDTLFIYMTLDNSSQRSN